MHFGWIHQRGLDSDPFSQSSVILCSQIWNWKRTHSREYWMTLVYLPIRSSISPSEHFCTLLYVNRNNACWSSDANQRDRQAHCWQGRLSHKIRPGQPRVKFCEALWRAARLAMQAWSVLNRHWLRTAVGIFQISLAPIGSHAWSWAAENLRSDASFWKQSSWNFPASSTFRILLSKVSTLRQWCDVCVEKAILGCGFQSQFLFPSQTSSTIINHHQPSSTIIKYHQISHCAFPWSKLSTLRRSCTETAKSREFDKSQVRLGKRNA